MATLSDKVDHRAEAYDAGRRVGFGVSALALGLVTFLSLIGAEKAIPAIRPFRSWWFVIIRNCCRDLLRRKRTRGSPVDIEHSDVAVTPSPDADRREEMRNAFQQLSEAHREVLELRYYGECSYREIAAVLDVPEGTVMSRLYAARRALAAVYKRREE